MAPETRSQDARKVDGTTNPEQTQAYDHIQQQLNDSRVDANTHFRELKEAMDALVAAYLRFGGEKNPLKELIELKQKNDLETYIKDFDILWNRSEISEKNAFVFFIGGLDIEVKNMIKMFEPKSLKQAYTLARLHDNTLTCRRYGSNPNKQTYHPTTFAYQNKSTTPASYNKNFPTRFPNTNLKQPQTENGEGSEEKGAIDLDPDTYNPYISLNVLEGVMGLNTL
uniref:Ty3 transposon capsid-like protein domain-containing protein n=1 Tax=Populus alba TaxID=43335 RepID=A0A4U5PLU3_POPAL|nr:hypothetical protein D5086_0000206350 [Populus alba]